MLELVQVVVRRMDHYSHRGVQGGLICTPKPEMTSHGVQGGLICTPKDRSWLPMTVPRRHIGVLAEATAVFPSAAGFLPRELRIARTHQKGPGASSREENPSQWPGGLAGPG